MVPTARMAARLTQVQIKGFKAIYDSGAVPLRPLTLLIGRNGSGKSSLVEAIQLLQSAAADGLQQSILDRYRSFDNLLNRRGSAKNRVRFQLDLLRGAAPLRYELEFSSVGVLTEECREGRTKAQRQTVRTRSDRVRLIAKGPPIRDRDVLALSHVTKTGATGAKELLDFLRAAVFLRLSPDVLSRPEPLTRPARRPVLDETGAGVVALLRALTKAQREKVARSVAAIISGVEEVKVLQDATRGYYATTERMLSRGGSKAFDVPAWMLSEGTRRLTAIYALLARTPRPSLLVIEEIENGLDPWTLQRVFGDLRVAADEGVQIIVTTHSPFLLDHVGIDDVLHTRREQGDTTYKPIRSYDDVIKYDGIVMPGAMYASGYFK